MWRDGGQEVHTLKRPRRGTTSRFRRRPPRTEALETGQKLHDAREGKTGVVLDTARQYSHPKADPVYSYLVRWDDGQVQAITEAALDDQDLEIVD